jgi:hypothetical protein
MLDMTASLGATSGPMVGGDQREGARYGSMPDLQIRGRGNSPGVGFDCRQHGRFFTGMVIKLMESNEWTRRAWENALMVAKRAAKLGDLPLIKSDYL